ncbi:MAG: fructosamine kinase family protein [Robiginitalea sp.]
MQNLTLIKDLEKAFGLNIKQLNRASGGDIAESYIIEAHNGRFFAKILNNTNGLDMLEAESEGLQAIARTGTLPVPRVEGCASLGSGSCLLLEYIPVGAERGRSFEALGRGLAQMHHHTSASFGWPRQNYIGTLDQVNTPNPSWDFFYCHYRLLPQYRLALDKGFLSASEIPEPEWMLSRISNLLPEIKPALLHGDLWSGNYLISSSGTPYLIDPSAYFGHAEVDLAMSLLFGGFPSRFYDAYFEIAPQVAGFEVRVALYQLYYLLVHLNLFGRSYYRKVVETGSRLFLS